jgi:hypothetical protein
MLKRLGIDLLGILLIILAILLGWLPGPGGIPMLIAGLGLLSINHEWARRWINNVEKHGLTLSSKIFRDHTVWKICLDIVGTLLLGLGIWLFTSATRNYLYAIATSTTCLSLVLILGNRKRLKRITNYFKAQA